MALIDDKVTSPFSLRTEDILKGYEGVSPITVSTMMLADQRVDRQRQQAMQQMEPLQRRREAEVISEAQEDSTEILSPREWARLQYPEMAARKSKAITRQESAMLERGYTMYLAMQKQRAATELSRQRGALIQAQIGKEQAHAGSFERANRYHPKDIEAYLVDKLGKGEPLTPRDMALWNNQPELVQKTKAEALKTAYWRERDKLDRQLKVNLAQMGIESEEGIEAEKIASRERIAAMKGGPAGKPLVPDSTIRKLIVSGKNIGTLDKENKTAGFKDWMEEQYLPVARSLSPEQKKQIGEAIRDHIPSKDELTALVQEAVGKPGKVRRWWPDTPGIPANYENLEFAIEALRLLGASEQAIAAMRKDFDEMAVQEPE